MKRAQWDLGTIAAPQRVRDSCGKRGCDAHLNCASNIRKSNNADKKVNVVMSFLPNWIGGDSSGREKIVPVFRAPFKQIASFLHLE